MTKLVNTRWRTRAAVALVIAASLAGCGRRDDLDDGSGDGGGGGGGNSTNNPTDRFAITSANRLVTFSRNNPSVRTAVNITGLAANETFVGFDVRPADSTLIGVSNAGRLYRINTDGTTTMIAQLAAAASDGTDPFMALDGTSFGVNFNPVPDRLRVVSNTGQNLRIDVSNGATVTDSTLSSINVTATTYTNSFPSACRTVLYYINTTTNQLLSTLNPNLGMLTTVGNLTINGNPITATVSGFEVFTLSDSTTSGPANTALVVLTSAGVSSLMTLNLGTAALINMQTIGGLNAGETITSISMAPPNSIPTQALGELVAVTAGTNRLISFNAASPQKLCTPATRITGLQAGDNVLGIDTRPRDSLLYAVGSGGRLYTISTVAGMNFAAATMGPLLQPASGSQFNGLIGNEFGLDFNPMTDRLRMVSNLGQNLSINVADGTVMLNTALNPANPGVTAAAYTNSLPNANATTLYVIDTSNETLSIQGQPATMPANGILVQQGSLGIPDVTGSSGFDIDGRNMAGVGVAALTLASTTPAASDLFNINLSTGAAERVTPVSTIGGGERIRALAFASTPAPMLMAVTSDNQLITFDAETPDTLVDQVAIDGLQGGESVVALQTQAGGTLQITTDGQRTYTLDATTGKASLMASASVTVARPTAPTSASGVRFTATAAVNGLSFGAQLTGLNQSRLFSLDASGTPTAVGMIGPSGTASVRALAIRMN